VLFAPYRGYLTSLLGIANRHVQPITFIHARFTPGTDSELLGVGHTGLNDLSPDFRCLQIDPSALPPENILLKLSLD
jgi:hypothetical protein